jgi:hypothetical protein
MEQAEAQKYPSLARSVYSKWLTAHGVSTHKVTECAYPESQVLTKCPLTHK